MSLQVANIKGISIKIHFSLLLVFLLISWTLSTEFMPEYIPNLSQIQYWIIGITGTIILFVSVLAHELSHSIVAIKIGIKVKQIILFIFGGVSDIEEEPKNFINELKMAIAGPVTSFALSGFFAFLFEVNLFLSAFTSNNSLLFATSTMAKGIFFYSSIINLILAVFNLIPAFPMDGGRVLRALLFQRNKNYEKSTKVSVRIGIIVSYIFIGLGFLTILSGSLISGIWIILMGWFLQNGAQSYLYQYDVMKTLSNVRLGEIMKRDIIAVSEDMTIEDILKNYFREYMKSAFPVLNSNSNELAGIIILRNCLEVPEKDRFITTVKNVMLNRDKAIVMDFENTADQALIQMVKKNLDKIFICDSKNMLIGIVSKTDILNSIDRAKTFMNQK